MESERAADRTMKIPALIRKLLTHRYLAVGLRLYIAGLFIYAGMYKINYAAEFAETIASYRLAPYWAVNFLAITMPWIELISGILLVCGIRVRSAIAVAGSLLVIFTLAIAINLIWQAPISCGCFHTLEDAISWKTLVRDLIWTAMAAQVFLYDRVFRLEPKLDWMVKEM
jgi:putative oxidoreductase